MAHIPKSDTKSAGFLSYKEACIPTNETFDRSRWIYVPDSYSEYRYILGHRCKRPLITIGVNPSTAAPEQLDNTLKSVERIARANGYDGFIMFNLYAQRATVPSDMERSFNEELHVENLTAFRDILSGIDSPAVWAAWGAVIKERDYLKRCAVDMVEIGEKYGAIWYTAGKRSKNGGHPHHPLYLKSDTGLDLFDAREYLASIVLSTEKTLFTK